jgi:hydroxymethylbilane synthase
MPVSSEGDVDKESPLTEIGGRGVFTSSLQRALELGEVDAAVHSCKDVPSISAAGLTLAAFPQREDARDALVSRHGLALAELPADPVIGTSSRRRAVQLLERRPDAKIVDLRGNIDTRLRKSESEALDAVVLAAAGLARMGWLERAVELLPVDVFTPAPGQGALVIETRTEPDPSQAIVAMVDDADVRSAIEVERAFLRGIGGGCTTPLGAFAQIDVIHGQPRVRFHAMLAREDGEGLHRVFEEWPLDGAVDRAFEVAKAMVRHVRPNRIAGGGTAFKRQLRGLNIICTGTDTLVEEVGQEVGRRGGESLVLPTIRIVEPENRGPLDEACLRLERAEFEHVVFTSRRAVVALGQLLPQVDTERVSIAAIGDATADELKKVGVIPRVVAQQSNQEGMLEALLPIVKHGDRVLLPQSDRARKVLARGLSVAGAVVDEVVAYQTQLIAEPPPDIVSLSKQGEIGAVLLASPSAVEAFVDQLGSLLPAMSGATFVSIGAVTAASMSEHGLPVHAVAHSPGAVGMVDALALYLWGEPAVNSCEEGAG